MLRCSFWQKFSNEFVTTHLYTLIEALNITSETTMMITEGKVDLLLQFDKYIRPKSLTEETYNVRDRMSLNIRSSEYCLCGIASHKNRIFRNVLRKQKLSFGFFLNVLLSDS